MINTDNTLDIKETAIAIAAIKDVFLQKLQNALNLIKVSAPLIIEGGAGINDDLNGIEVPVNVKLKGVNAHVEIIQSLAKWKRVKLKELGVVPDEGLVTDMKALRPDEDISEIHSFFVDQWDWEKKICSNDRTLFYLKSTVIDIYNCIRETANMVDNQFYAHNLNLPNQIHFIHAEELLKLYPDLSSKERENKVAFEHGAVFIIGIGGLLSNGEPHDGRAPDYDDWTSKNEDGYNGLNGDIIIWNPKLNRGFELSSMGIRVNGPILETQLKLRECEHRLGLNFHRGVIEEKYPLSIGGGIGQSRLCMLLLQKKHISEVQYSVWPTCN